MFVTVLLFARLRELAGVSELRRELPDGVLFVDGAAQPRG
jgi:molybdopterin converting factor small subunit